MGTLSSSNLVFDSKLDCSIVAILLGILKTVHFCFTLQGCIGIIFGGFLIMVDWCQIKWLVFLDLKYKDYSFGNILAFLHFPDREGLFASSIFKVLIFHFLGVMAFSYSIEAAWSWAWDLETSILHRGYSLSSWPLVVLEQGILDWWSKWGRECFTVDKDFVSFNFI